MISDISVGRHTSAYAEPYKLLHGSSTYKNGGSCLSLPSIIYMPSLGGAYVCRRDGGA